MTPELPAVSAELPPSKPEEALARSSLTPATRTAIWQVLGDLDEQQHQHTKQKQQDDSCQFLPVRLVLRESFLFWLASLLAMAALTYFAILLPNDSHWMQTFTWRTLADTWNQWDAAQFYLPLAVHGYQHATVAESIQANFFPLYPALVHVAWLLTGKHHLVGAALAISDLGALAALCGVALLARGERFTRAQLRWTLLLFIMASPLAFFLFAPYPTSWLVATIAWSLTCARARYWRGHWYMAAALALFAPLWHPTGIVLWPTLLVEFGSQQRKRPVPSPRALRCTLQLLHIRQWPVRLCWAHLLRLSFMTQRKAEVLLQGILVFVSMPSGLWLYSWYCQHTYGDPLAYLHTQQHWFQHVPHWPWQTIQLLIANWRRMPTASYAQARLLVDLLPLFFALVVFAWACWLRLRNRNQLPLPASFFVLWLTLLYLCIAEPVVGTIFQDVILSAGRYLLAAVPLPLFLAAQHRRHPHLLVALLYCGIVLQVLFASYYLNGGWLV